LIRHLETKIDEGVTKLTCPNTKCKQSPLEEGQLKPLISEKKF